MSERRQPYEHDFAEYVESRGGVYQPFSEAVRFVYSLEWTASIWEALLAGIRPPAHRVAEMLRLLDHQKPYLPLSIAADYPSVPNPYAPEEHVP